MVVVILLFLMIMMSGCGQEKETKDWIADDLAGIENPGFTIASKNETNNAISFVLEDVDIDMVNQFLESLYGNTEFTININYNYDTSSYSYAAFNDKQESIHFTYYLEDHSGYFIYAKSGDALFVPGIRDMGYLIRANYDYMSNLEETKYNASIFYTFALNVEFTNSSERLISFVLNDFQFKSLSALGTLSFRNSFYTDPIENYTITGSSIYDLHFIVVQKNIGQYSIYTTHESTPAVFDLMEISQSNLDFIVTFTADMTTTFGTYTYNYEIKVMPTGSDVTEMNRYMDVYHYTKTIDEGIPFTKLD